MIYFRSNGIRTRLSIVACGDGAHKPLSIIKLYYDYAHNQSTKELHMLERSCLFLFTIDETEDFPTVDCHPRLFNLVCPDTFPSCEKVNVTNLIGVWTRKKKAASLILDFGFTLQNKKKQAGSSKISLYTVSELLTKVIPPTTNIYLTQHPYNNYWAYILIKSFLLII